MSAVIKYSRAIDLFRILGDSQGLASSLPVRSLLASPAQAEPVATLHWDLATCDRDAIAALSLYRQIDWVSGEAMLKSVSAYSSPALDTLAVLEKVVLPIRSDSPWAGPGFCQHPGALVVGCRHRVYRPSGKDI